MKLLYSLLDSIRLAIRGVMRIFAHQIDILSGGRVGPITITLIGFVAHIPIALFIYGDYLVLAGAWLIVFGLFDALDGELARLQKRESPAGMFLDSVTDRMKEVLLYAGIGGYLIQNIHGFKGCRYDLLGCINANAVPEVYLVVIVALVLGGSLITSYINAWGEAVTNRAGIKNEAMNKAFRGGLASFEIRMTIIIIGLFTGYLLTAIIVIGILVTITIIQRLFKVFRALNSAHN